MRDVISPVLFHTCAGALALAVAAQSVPAQPEAWTDSSPHRVRWVAVQPGVTLEVLDWGGVGEPMVFLAGMGNTAHSFDRFAPRFRDAYHVYAVTRRGFGASSFPDSGYSSARRAQDIVTVLDSLGLQYAILVGHSVAGDELSAVASAYPARVRALVYLDAYSYGTDAPTEFPDDPPQSAPPVMTVAESASVQGLVRYWKRRFGFEPIEGEVRAVARLGPDGRVLALTKPTASGDVYKGTVRSAYARIRAPTLGIYARHYTVAQYFPAVATFDAENRRMAETFVAAQRKYEKRQIARFRAEVQHATVLEIPGANHYLHYSHPARVERTMRTFLQANLRRTSRPTTR